jgi:hypothetical protein
MTKFSEIANQHENTKKARNALQKTFWNRPLLPSIFQDPELRELWKQQGWSVALELNL